jgi:hypothetical protein
MMRDKLAETIKEFLDGCEGEYREPDLADAIIAALPGMVSELVWEVRRPPEKTAQGFWAEAMSISGRYEIHQFDGAGGQFYLHVPGKYRMSEHDCHSYAQAAANEHYRAAIMRAMGV